MLYKTNGMFTPIEENYLKALYSLANSNGEVNVNELSKHLNIKMPTVNSMIKKFAEKELVIYESYKPVQLSPKGKKEAAKIIRKHRLTEMFLVQVMGFGWEEVHEIAEQIEHIKSNNFFDKMDELLDYPQFDPHGSPIPDKNGKVINPHFIKLSDCKLNDNVIIKAISDSSNEFLLFLNSKEIHLGNKAEITGIETYDKTFTLKFSRNKTEVFSKLVCDKLLVQKIE